MTTTASTHIRPRRHCARNPRAAGPYERSEKRSNINRGVGILLSIPKRLAKRGEMKKQNALKNNSYENRTNSAQSGGLERNGRGERFLARRGLPQCGVSLANIRQCWPFQRSRSAREKLRKNGLAEREGFEPSIRFPVYTLSKRAPSATRPPLQHNMRRFFARPPPTVPACKNLRKSAGQANTCGCIQDTGNGRRRHYNHGGAQDNRARYMS